MATILFAWAFGRLGGIQGAWFIAPFTMFPFMINVVLAWRWRTIAGQTLLMCASLPYAVWSTIWYMFVLAMPDPQSPIALLFTGFYALPLLGLLLGLAVRPERRQSLA